MEWLNDNLFEDVDKLNVRENGVTRDSIMDGVTLYHRPKDATAIVGGKKMSIADALFTYGFSREFTNSNGGNMYGAGVYTVYNLKSSLEKASGYGKAIIKAKLLGGYRDFLLFSEQLAKETYGNRWKIWDQIDLIFPKNSAQQIKNTVHLIMHDDSRSFHDMAKSSTAAYDVVNRLGESGMNNSKCRGLVYNGGHDGACCFVRDFSSVVPVAISYDNGKTWQNKLSDDLINRVQNEVDTYYQYGGGNEYKEISKKSINGYTLVVNKENKINYIPSNSNKTISDVWFDDGENWEKSSSGIPFVNVRYKDNYLTLKYKNGDYFVYDEDGCPLDITIKEIPELLNEETKTMDRISKLIHEAVEKELRGVDVYSQKDDQDAFDYVKNSPDGKLIQNTLNRFGWNLAGYKRNGRMVSFYATPSGGRESAEFNIIALRIKDLLGLEKIKVGQSEKATDTTGVHFFEINIGD